MWKSIHHSCSRDEPIAYTPDTASIFLLVYYRSLHILDTGRNHHPQWKNRSQTCADVCVSFFPGDFSFVFLLLVEPFILFLSFLFVDSATVLCCFAPLASFIMTVCLNGDDVTSTADSAFQVLARLPCIWGGGDWVLMSARTTQNTHGKTHLSWTILLL